MYYEHREKGCAGVGANVFTTRRPYCTVSISPFEYTVTGVQLGFGLVLFATFGEYKRVSLRFVVHYDTAIFFSFEKKDLVVIMLFIF